MKSSFLFALLLATLTGSAWAQATTEKSSFDKFYERLKIGYFGAYSGSSLGDWNPGASDEGGTTGRGYAHNLFNQISFNYNYGGKLSYVFNPRFTIYTGSTAGHSDIDNALVNVEDAVTGFQGVLYTSPDKKFGWWSRFAARIPFSRRSRREDITIQPDWANTLTYDADSAWQFGVNLGLRHWVYENRWNSYRYRLSAAPYVQYAVNDTTKLQLWYEHYSENRKRLESVNNLEHKLEEKWQTLLLGVAKDVTPKLNVFPFLGYHLNTQYGLDKYPLNAAWVGAWISYQIK